MVISDKDAERYKELFKKLDQNSDGKLDVQDLVKAFEQNRTEATKESSLKRAKVTSVQTLLCTVLVSRLFLLHRK